MRSPRRTTAVVAAIAAALAIGVPAGGAVTGEVRVLVVLATWGPLPFEVEQAERVLAGTASFYGASSGGRLALGGAVVGPVTLHGDGVDFCSSTSLEAALRASAPAVPLDAFQRVAWVVPRSSCGWVGEAQGTHVVLNGALTTPLAAHELGHTFGLGHASRWACDGAFCRVDEYGGSFSVMGGGAGDLNAYEKHQLGWLGALAHARADGTFALAPVEVATTAAQALVIETAQAEYWLEARSQPTPSFAGGSTQPPGVVVLGGPSSSPVAQGSRFARSNLVLPNPAGGARFAYAPGETVRIPGVFEVSVERNDASGASLRFRWVDRTPPARPRLGVRAQRGRRLALRWLPAVERGSGLDRHLVLVDGRVVRTLGATALHASVRLGRGRHTVGVAAVDRAGNRGPALTVRATAR